MKTRLFTSALLLAVSLSSFAQDKATLKATTQKMIDLTDQQNYGDLVGTVYPQYFNIVSKDDYSEQLQKKMKGDGYTIQPVRVEPSIDYGAVKKADDITFCLVNYDTAMTIELDGKLAPKDIPAKEAYFKKLLNTENVYYVENTNTIDVKKRVQLVALADESTYQQWTFINPEAPGASAIIHDLIKKELDPENTEIIAKGTPDPVVETPEQAKKSEAKRLSDAKIKSVQKKP